jgi:hypothetical protein
VTFTKHQFRYQLQPFIIIIIMIIKTLFNERTHLTNTRATFTKHHTRQNHVKQCLQKSTKQNHVHRTPLRTKQATHDHNGKRSKQSHVHRTKPSSNSKWHRKDTKQSNIQPFKNQIKHDKVPSRAPTKSRRNHFGQHNELFIYI